MLGVARPVLCKCSKMMVEAQRCRQQGPAAGAGNKCRGLPRTLRSIPRPVPGFLVLHSVLLKMQQGDGRGRRRGGGLVSAAGAGDGHRAAVGGAVPAGGAPSATGVFIV